MEMESGLKATTFPAFEPPLRLDWHYVAYLVSWIVSRTQDEFELLQEALPFLFDLPTILQRRNELTRRILRVLVDPTRSMPLVQDQTGAYWLDVLAADHRSGAHLESGVQEDKDDELANLCRQFGEVAIQN
ncbi:hypothetical protein D9615_000071 [Tricholomella constricta]|uniref:Uncharacterized protein n=1 Tax=Tricholomella constricta TaxID=117010 RepID=A0A8H5HS24_9AGAR|nr:hypothetical protein D9615_000071 [Tricholomella constricta]